MISIHNDELQVRQKEKLHYWHNPSKNLTTGIQPTSHPNRIPKTHNMSREKLHDYHDLNKNLTTSKHTSEWHTQNSQRMSRERPGLTLPSFEEAKAAIIIVVVMVTMVVVVLGVVVMVVVVSTVRRRGRVVVGRRLLRLALAEVALVPRRRRRLLLLRRVVRGALLPARRRRRVHRRVPWRRVGLLRRDLLVAHPLPASAAAAIPFSS